MHEMSLAQGIAEICIDHARGRKVLSVVLEIGELSNILPDSIEFCFDACSRDSVLEGAKLMIKRIPGRGRCRECCAELEMKAYYEPCSACGSYAVDVLTGEELSVKELEVE